MRRVLLVLAAWAALLALPARARDTVTYYLTDSLHSVVVELNAQRQVIARTYYAPYGQVLNRPLRNGPGYTGHEEDPATGLVYMQQRYYDPEARRFISTDPVAADPNTGGSFNRYEYAKDNPYRYTDPFGMCTGSHISNSDGTCASSGDFTTQASNAHLPGASAAQRGAMLGLRESSQSRSSDDQQTASSSTGNNQQEPNLASDRFVVTDPNGNNQGTWTRFTYQLVDTSGASVTGSGYSASEHVLPDFGSSSNANNVYLPLVEGRLDDRVGWTNPNGLPTANNVYLFTQHFTVKYKNGNSVPLTTEFGNMSGYLNGAYINQVWVIKP